MTDEPVILQFSGGGQTAVCSAALPERTVIIETMQGQEIEPADPQPGHRQFDFFDKLLRVIAGYGLGLKYEIVSGDVRQDPAELLFRRSVAVSGFDVVDAVTQGRFHDFFQLSLRTTWNI